MKLRTMVGTAALALAPLTLAGVGLTAETAMATPNPPVITSVLPGTGLAGQPVVIDGANFLGTTAVQFGNKAASFTVITNGVIDATVPAEQPGHGLVTVRVTTPSGTSDVPGTEGQFLYQSPISTVTIRNAHSGMCLDAGADVNGSHVTQESCDSLGNQTWTFEANREIRSASGKCLDVTGYGTVNGSKLQTWTCLGNTNQLWKEHGEFAGSALDFEIEGVGSLKALDDTGYSLAAGTQVQIWSFLDGTNQLWSL